MKWTYVLCLFALVSCGGPLKYKVAATSKAAGADALITADVDKTQRTTALDVDATNLPPADRVVPAATVYVAWYRKSTATPWLRLGALAYEAGGRRARLNSTAAETKFDLEISAESEIAPAAPSSDIIFAQSVGQ